MASVIVDKQYVEYGSLLNYNFYVGGKKVINNTAVIRRGFRDKFPIKRMPKRHINGPVEVYNHEKKCWEVEDHGKV